MQATLEYFKDIKKLHTYKYFIFLNSSVRGPFHPSFMPIGWQWPDAFVSRLGKMIHLVASSIVCLPAEDAGGYGPKAGPLASLHMRFILCLHSADASRLVQACALP